MPFCPKCKAEYLEGIAVCADCGVGLVAKLPPPPRDPTPVETEAVFDAPNMVAADNVRDMLEGNGIAVWMRSFESSYYDGIGVLMEGVWGRLWVRKEEAARARALIADLQEAEDST